jgi:hypothetical protein
MAQVVEGLPGKRRPHSLEFPLLLNITSGDYLLQNTEAKKSLEKYKLTWFRGTESSQQ